MAPKRSDETRAAVIAALMTGQSINSVAEEYNIPVGTVKGWKNRYGYNQLQNSVTNVTSKKAEIGDKLLVYLSQALDTLAAQVKCFGDEKWLQRQPASEVAVLHGVIADKTIRLLEALSTTAEQPAEIASGAAESEGGGKAV